MHSWDEAHYHFISQVCARPSTQPISSHRIAKLQILHILKFAHLKIAYTVDCTKHKISFAECAQIAQFDNAVEEQEEPSMCDSMRSYCHLNEQCNMHCTTYLLLSSKKSDLVKYYTVTRIVNYCTMHSEIFCST